MAYRVLELTLISARDLKKVNLVSRMEVYAVASVSGNPLKRQSTPPDRSGGRDPTWNVTLSFLIPATAAAASGTFLHVLLRTERPLGDRDVGEVFVPLPNVLAGAYDGLRPAKYASYNVFEMHSSKPCGVLNFSYQLSSVAYPVVPYYPPPPTYGYVQPAPPPGYGYPPAGHGTGEAPPVVQPSRKKKKKHFGLGLGAGMLGAALGGMLIADMVSDEADNDAGHVGVDATDNDAAGQIRI